MKIKVKAKVNNKKVSLSKEEFAEAEKRAEQYLLEEEKSESVAEPEAEAETEYIEDIAEVFNGEKARIKKKNSIPWRNYLVYLVLITSLSTCVTFSRYVSEFINSSSAEVARFDVMVAGVGDNALQIAPKENDIAFSKSSGVMEQTYTVNVKNNSDVAVNVQVVINREVVKHPIEIAEADRSFDLKPGDSRDVLIKISAYTSGKGGDDNIEKGVGLEFISTQID